MTEEAKKKTEIPVTVKKDIKTKKVFCIMKKGVFLSLFIVSFSCQLLCVTILHFTLFNSTVLK